MITHDIKEDVIEFLIINQPYIKEELKKLKHLKDTLKATENQIFHQDIEEQCEQRIKQWIAMYTSDRLAIPYEYVFIQLEKIDVQEYINV
jgi:hypothetical protein